MNTKSTEFMPCLSITHHLLQGSLASGQTPFSFEILRCHFATAFLMVSCWVLNPASESFDTDFRLDRESLAIS